jgi:tetrahydromethanopterin S-methyltransferase subunit F
MQKWVTGISRALMMGLAWAVAWMPIGLLVGFIVDRDGSMDEPWIAAGTYPGFLCGVVFSVVAGFAARRRRLDQFSLAFAGPRGLVRGLLVGGLWVLVALLSDPAKWLLNLAVVGSLTLLSAFSGIGSALLARMGKNDTSARVA